RSATRCASRRTSAVVTSYLDLGAELDDTVRRDAEKLGRPRRNAYQSGIEAFAPPRHPGTRTRFDVSATDEERELIRIKFQPRNVRSSQLPRYVWRLGKTEMRFNLPKTAAELTRFDPVCARHSRNVLGHHAYEQHGRCNTLLCLRLFSRVSGTFSVCVVSKTAVPETRASGASSQVARKEASGTAWLANRASTNRRPARQVVMIVNTTIPITSGNQPPLGILSAFEPNNARSTVMIGTRTTAIVGHCQRQTPRMTVAASTVVMLIVPVTANPYAEASALELWNPKTKARTANTR